MVCRYFHWINFIWTQKPVFVNVYEILNEEHQNEKKTAEMNDIFHVGAHALTHVNIRVIARLCNSACME